MVLNKILKDKKNLKEGISRNNTNYIKIPMTT